MERSMDAYQFGEESVTIARCFNMDDIRSSVAGILSREASILPGSRDALIVLKPNLNNDLNALTGNSTDLRILVSVIEWLKGEGYENMVVADGHNVGVDRRDIDVYKRLRIDRLVRHYGIRLLNLNRDAYREATLSSQKVRISRTALEADLFVNLPKIKTHAEATLSLCLKNMIGCVVGQEKRKVHGDLNENIVRLNEMVIPHLHIVDGLMVMEGNGPGDGRPVRLDLLVSGANPFLVDLVCAKLVGVDWREIGYLAIAKERGYLSDRVIHDMEGMIQVVRQLERPPDRNIITRVLDHQGLYWLKRLIRPITSRQLVAETAYGLHIIQDRYDPEDDGISEIFRDEGLCVHCGRCTRYCPMGIEEERIGNVPRQRGCICCLYCYFVCPEGALRLVGKPGFLSGQIDRYGHEIRTAVLTGGPQRTPVVQNRGGPADDAPR